MAQVNSNISQNDSSENIFGEEEGRLNNFAGYIYYIQENTSKLPDFTLLKPVGVIYTNSINVSDQNFKKGFPGVSNRFEYFAIDYKGEFYIEDSSNYCFNLGSDDGSKLFIDEKLIISNDFLHGYIEKSNCIKLSKGSHKIEVQYFQGPSNVALILRYRKIDEEEFQVFNLSQLYPISVNEKDSSIDISIGDEILFDFNSCELSEGAKQALGEIKRLIIDKTKFKLIIIEGHTDDIGSEDYNMKLSENRANSVNNYLTNIGVNPQLMKTIACGEMKPKVQNIDDESRKKNRRIEMSLIKMDK